MKTAAVSLAQTARPDIQTQQSAAEWWRVSLAGLAAHDAHRGMGPLVGGGKSERSLKSNARYDSGIGDSLVPDGGAQGSATE